MQEGRKKIGVYSEEWEGENVVRIVGKVVRGGGPRPSPFLLGVGSVDPEASETEESQVSSVRASEAAADVFPTVRLWSS